MEAMFILLSYLPVGLRPSLSRPFFFGKSKIVDWCYADFCNSLLEMSCNGVIPAKYAKCHAKHRFDDKTGTPQRRSILGMASRVCKLVQDMKIACCGLRSCSATAASITDGVSMRATAASLSSLKLAKLSVMMPCSFKHDRKCAETCST